VRVERTHARTLSAPPSLSDSLRFFIGCIGPLACHLGPPSMLDDPTLPPPLPPCPMGLPCMPCATPWPTTGLAPAPAAAACALACACTIICCMAAIMPGFAAWPPGRCWNIACIIWSCCGVSCGTGQRVQRVRWVSI
jgi:hypothetical protein